MKSLFNKLLNKFKSPQLHINISPQGIYLNNQLLTDSYLKNNEKSYRINYGIFMSKVDFNNIYYIDDKHGISCFCETKYNGEVEMMLKLYLAQDQNYIQEFSREYKRDYFYFMAKNIFTGLLTINDHELDFSQNDFCHKRHNNSRVNQVIGKYGCEFSFVSELNKAFLQLEQELGLSSDSSDEDWSEFNRKKLALINNYNGEIFREMIVFEKTLVSEENIKPKVKNKVKQKKRSGESLSFTNFNFKLLVIEELMYHQKVLSPEFDVYDFCESYKKREIEPDDYYFEMIPEVKTWFEKLEIGKEYAQYIEHLSFDGGNEIYMQLIPQWDGESDIFDIKEISEIELAQFPNLKTIEANISAQLKQLCQKQGIAVIDN